MKNKLLISLFAGSILMLSPVVGTAQGEKVVTIDPASPGRTFEGLGALSAGASSRLLIDYPEPQRSEILDFLFKPNFGASLQHLKVEIGGDVNSTDGTEPSIARTREEFIHPKPEYFNRGYEWWLMKEAKKRNPNIILDILQWGAPGWIGDGKFYSQDNADFIVAFIKGAKKYHDLDINYCGIWNERLYNVEWIKLLRQTLNRAGLESVQIVAADEVNKWTIADKMAEDQALCAAVNVIGTHYPYFKSSPAAMKLGKPIWANEDGPWSGRWAAPSQFCFGLAQAYNRNYIVGKMTKSIIWSPVTSYYDIFAIPGSGLMKANQPWSGHYEVQPAIWITAHTTQFIQPGWKYLAGNACALLPGGGSHVAAVSPDGKDISLVIETFGAKQSQTLDFKLVDLSARQLSLWRSTAKEQFIRQPDLPVRDGGVTLVVEPGVIYSLTTATGQQKGTTTIPAPCPMPLPYKEDFENCRAGGTPKYLSDTFGGFDIITRKDGGQCLQQVVPRRGIVWGNDKDPVTLVGSPSWRDYEVTCDVQFDFQQHACIWGRVKTATYNTWSAGYCLRVNADGAWQLLIRDKPLQTGKRAIQPGQWYRLGLRFKGDHITVLFDGQTAGAATDATCRQGFAGLGSGYEAVKFDNLSIVGETPAIALQPVRATSSSDWSDEYTADKATDGDAGTRWNTARSEHTGWLEMDFGKPVTIARAVIDESFKRIKKFALEAQQPDGTWQAIVTGTTIGDGKELTFAPITARKFRLNILECPPETPTIDEIHFWEK